MKKLFLLKLSLLGVGVSCALNANAQGTLASDNEVLGARLIVEAPASIAGVKPFTISSSVSPAWGAPLTTPYQNVELIKAVDSEACTGLTNTVTGKWVLIYRGNCEFGVKAKNAQDKGAAGVVIWNHTPGELLNMGAGAVGSQVTIPVVMISHEDGRAITNRFYANEQVFLSLTPWGFNKTHDLAIVPGTPAPPPGMAIPFSQFTGNNPAQYRGYVGGYVANTGTSTETNVKLKATVNWTPNGGSATQVHTDSAVIASFPTSDSVKYDLFSADHFNFSPTGIGRYDFHYEVSANDADEYTFDNTHNFSLNITPNAFSRGRINVQTQAPIVSGHNRLSDASQSFTWGPTFFVNKGGYHLSHALFSVADNDTSDHDLTGVNEGKVEVFLFKWTDGANSNPTDNVMQTDELTLKGIGVKTFTATDSNRTMLTAYFGDAVNGANAQIVSEDNSTYWVAVNLNNTFALSSDRVNNYHARSAAAMKFATSKTPDYWSTAFLGTKVDIDENPGTNLRMFPFGFATANIDSLAVTNGEAVPALTLITGVFPVSTKEVVKASGDLFSVYPNPATINVTAKINMTKSTDKLNVKIIDGLGRQVYSEVRRNVKDTEVTIPVSNFAAGNYYMIMISDDNAMARPFTVAGK